MVIDVWMQHPTHRFLQGDMFASLRRWVGQQLPEEELPLKVTVGVMDDAGVAFGLLTPAAATPSGSSS